MGGLILEVIFSMIKQFWFNKTWSDNGGGLIPGGLIPEVPLYTFCRTVTSTLLYTFHKNHEITSWTKL